MSEMFDTSITAVAEPLRDEVVRAAGITAVGAVKGGALLAAGALALLQDLALAAAAEHRASMASMPASSELARVRAALGALETRDELSLLRAAGDTVRKSGLGEVRSALQRAEEQFARSQSSLVPCVAAVEATTSAASALDRVVAQATARLQSAELRVLTDATKAALAEIGYVAPEVLPQRPGAVLIKGASSTGVSIWVELDVRQGHVVADLSGCSGTACEGKRDEFLQALRSRGVTLRLLQRQLHGRAEGGSLVQRVASRFKSPVKGVDKGREFFRSVPPRVSQKG